MSRALLTIGFILCIIGLLWPWLSRLGLGRLPGDIMIEQKRWKLYVPITTSIILSVLLNIVARLLRR